MPTIIHARYTLRDGVALENLALCVDGEYIVDAGALPELLARHPGLIGRRRQLHSRARIHQCA